jgi:alpha-galactosidase
LWAANQRNASGAIEVDHKKFPSGMPAFAAKLAKLGMKLGLYTARSNRTCSGAMPGSLGNEVIDARTFAEMGAVFLKNDDCRVKYSDAAKDYGAMQRAIAALPAVAMIHSTKAPDLGPVDAPKVTQFRRVGKDLKDDWQDVVRLLDTANDERYLQLSGQGQGFFSDLDMLEVGNPGNGKPMFPGQQIGKLSADEQQSHFSLWAAIKSPLVIGVRCALGHVACKVWASWWVWATLHVQRE